MHMHNIKTKLTQYLAFVIEEKETPQGSLKHQGDPPHWAKEQTT